MISRIFLCSFFSLFCLLFAEVLNAAPVIVTVNPAGIEANGRSSLSSGIRSSTLTNFSVDGRYLVYDSEASDLVTNDSNAVADIFIYDGNTKTTERISVASDGSQSNGASAAPSISADGRFVAFESEASNLVTDDVNSSRDIFLHDRQTGETRRISANINQDPVHDGEPPKFAPILSSDGRFAVFEGGNFGSGLHDREKNSTESIEIADCSSNSSGCSHDYNLPSISGNGQFVAGIKNSLIGENKEVLRILDRQTGTSQSVGQFNFVNNHTGNQKG